MSSQPQVAYLGLGIMGAAMVLNLNKNGHNVRAWNRTSNRPGVDALKRSGANVQNSVAEAVAGADVIFSCLGDIDDVEDVLVGQVAAHAKSGALLVDMTTIGPEAAIAIAKQLKMHRLRFLDAPVTGGDVGAREGTLTIMVGGDSSDFDEAKPLLETLGKKIAWCGAVGAGQALKLCNQILCAVNLIGTCEALALAERMNLDANLIVDILGGGAGGSWSLSNLGPRILKDDLAPGFPTEHMLKDLRLVHENADGLELPGTDLAEKLFNKVEGNKSEAAPRLGTQAMTLAYAGSKEAAKK